MTKPNTTAGQKSAARRIKSRTPGIYYRLLPDGKTRRYEFTYRDSTGRQRWQGGYSSLEDAADARADLRKRMKGGAHIAPTNDTLIDFCQKWLNSQAQIRDSTRSRYQWAISHHIAPRFPDLKVGKVKHGHLLFLIEDMQKCNMAAASIKAVLMILNLVLVDAKKQGAIAANPFAELTKRERPKGERKQMVILSREDVGLLLDATDAQHKPLISVLVFCGLRISECLGLRWRDVDLEAGLLHVRGQLDHATRERIDVTKTDAGERSVILMPSLGSLLVEHRLRQKPEFCHDDHLVFTTITGTPQNRDNVRNRILRPALKRAGLNQQIRTHDLRHTFASMLISGNADPVFVAGQLGHADPSVTLSIYSHAFDRQRHRDSMTAFLESGWGDALAGGNDLETGTHGGARSGAVIALPNTAPDQAIAV